MCGFEHLVFVFNKVSFSKLRHATRVERQLGMTSCMLTGIHEAGNSILFPMLPFAARLRIQIGSTRRA